MHEDYTKVLFQLDQVFFYRSHSPFPFHFQDIEVDAVARAGTVVLFGIIEHVERTGASHPVVLRKTFSKTKFFSLQFF